MFMITESANTAIPISTYLMANVLNKEKKYKFPTASTTLVGIDATFAKKDIFYSRIGVLDKILLLIAKK